MVSSFIIVLYINYINSSNIYYSKVKIYYSKSFFKDFREQTKFSSNRSYPQYKYLFIERISNIDINNKQLVSYNLYLLKKYNSSIKIKIFDLFKSIFYQYKYIYKGLDLANIILTRSKSYYKDKATLLNQSRYNRVQVYITK